jgi:hypothetical protein
MLIVLSLSFMYSSAPLCSFFLSVTAYNHAFLVGKAKPKPHSPPEFLVVEIDGGIMHFW